MLLPIVYYGNPLLRQRSAEIDQVTSELLQFMQDMLETMDANNGIGLAAVQVGRPIRLFILRNYRQRADGQFELTEPQCYINPKITILNDEPQVDSEGCLSIPGITAEVSRPLKLKVEAFNQNMEPFVEEVEGYKARVILHENDHINGVLFIDRLDHQTKNKLDPELRAIKKKYQERT